MPRGPTPAGSRERRGTALGALELPLLVQQPPQVDVRLRMARGQLERSPVGVARILGRCDLEMNAHLVPRVGVELGFGAAGRLRGAPDDRPRALGQLGDVEVEQPLAALRIPPLAARARHDARPLGDDRHPGEGAALGKIVRELLQDPLHARGRDPGADQLARGPQHDDVLEAERELPRRPPRGRQEPRAHVRMDATDRDAEELRDLPRGVSRGYRHAPRLCSIDPPPWAGARTQVAPRPPRAWDPCDPARGRTPSRRRAPCPRGSP